MLLPTLKSGQFVLRQFKRGDEGSLRKNINNRKNCLKDGKVLDSLLYAKTA